MARSRNKSFETNSKSRALARAPSPLAEVLPQVLRGLRTDTRLTREQIQKTWKRLVGEKAAQHSWPRRLRQGRLIVEVENSGWLYLLNLKKPQLIQGLVELLGASQVKDLSLRIGEKQDA